MTPALLLLLFFGPPDFAGLSKQATIARESGRVKDAIRLYRETVRVQPSWSEGWWFLGALLYDENSFAGAREAFARLVKLEPKAGQGWAFLGLCEFEANDYPNSLIHLERGLALGLKTDPQVAKVTRYHSAILLTLSGNFEVAIQRLTQLATLGGEGPQMIQAFGLAALRIPVLPSGIPEARRALVEAAGRAVYSASLRQVAEAQREFEALVAQYPGTPEIHNIYGTFLLASDPGGAIREWKREIAISPKHVPARLQLAFEYFKRNESEAGLPYAREAVKLEPYSFVAHNALGRLLIETGEPGPGIAELEKARDLAPDSAETRLALASAYAKVGREQDAARERAEFQRLRNTLDSPR